MEPNYKELWQLLRNFVTKFPYHTTLNVVDKMDELESKVYCKNCKEIVLNDLQSVMLGVCSGECAKEIGITEEENKIYHEVRTRLTKAGYECKYKNK